MKWFICPNSFKHSLSAKTICEVFVEVLSRYRPNDTFFTLPLGDGGQGTKHFIQSLWNCETEHAMAPDHFGSFKRVELLHFVRGGRPITFVESADVIGLELYSKKDPFRASSLGLGQLIQSLDPRREIWVGLGGSATVDAGFGLLKALRRPIKGKALCDVSVSLWDAKHFMSQKGVSHAQMCTFHNRLNRLAFHFPGTNPTIPGSGAAGGLGFALGARGLELVSGLEFLWSEGQMDQYLRQSNWLVTGEGKLDPQTWLGKGPGLVIQKAKNLRKKVLFICGEVGSAPPVEFQDHLKIIELKSRAPFVNAKDDLYQVLQNCLRQDFC